MISTNLLQQVRSSFGAQEIFGGHNSHNRIGFMVSLHPKVPEYSILSESYRDLKGT